MSILNWITNESVYQYYEILKYIDSKPKGKWEVWNFSFGSSE